MFTLHAMNIDILKHNTIKSSLNMSYASKGTGLFRLKFEAMFDFEQLVGSFLNTDKVKTFPQSAAWLLRVTHPHKVVTSP